MLSATSVKRRESSVLPCWPWEPCSHGSSAAPAEPDFVFRPFACWPQACSEHAVADAVADAAPAANAKATPAAPTASEARPARAAGACRVRAARGRAACRRASAPTRASCRASASASSTSSGARRLSQGSWRASRAVGRPSGSTQSSPRTKRWPSSESVLKAREKSTAPALFFRATWSSSPPYITLVVINVYNTLPTDQMSAFAS
mmetsp:Transcript_62108/g.178171  ORF Transcript_62108/g.178171 Transcript_62108/m.178171 type:complete len:205 (+) Transcript_62108:298-912(+)